MELKQILARQPGPEVAEQLSMYQSAAKEKTKQMKVDLFFIRFLHYFNPQCSHSAIICRLLSFLLRKLMLFS